MPLELQPTDGRRDTKSWAARLGVSREAIEIFAASDSIDLHIESFIWTRILGYDLTRRHGRGLLGARCYSQVDLPRMLDSGLTGSVWSIATNPWRPQRRRTATLLRNLHQLRATLAALPEHIAVVSDHAGYQRARAAGRHACWLAIQGGNALDSGPEAALDLDQVPDDCVSRITLLHMTSSTFGHTSAPSLALAGGHAEEGLTDRGKDFIRQMNARRILLDLAHINVQGFWDALDVHDRAQPAIVSHTGVRAVHDSWRNLDDAQIKAIAATGGVVGIIFHVYFLAGSLLGGPASLIADHLAHVIDVAGEDFVALGSDWDGMIVTPRDMPTVLELPVLVQHMLDRGWNAERIGKILGGNYLRVMQHIRPG